MSLTPSVLLFMMLLLLLLCVKCEAKPWFGVWRWREDVCESTPCFGGGWREEDRDRVMLYEERKGKEIESAIQGRKCGRLLAFEL